MKALMGILGILLISFCSLAQEKYAPVIKQGTKFRYFVLTTDGQSVPFIASFDSVASDYIRIGWNIEGFGTGTWVMKKASLDGATIGHWSQPAPGVTDELPDNEAVLLFSKAQWQSLQKDQKFDFDQQTFTVKQANASQQLKVQGKLIDAIFLESSSRSTHMWMLNNSAFPVLLKIEGNTGGHVDLELLSIE
jgi:hypothetical protein